jgi:hypothetical protein
VISRMDVLKFGMASGLPQACVRVLGLGSWS